MLANSYTISVIIPMKNRAAVNAAHPPHIFGGGTIANRSFQPMDKKCIKAS